ncbi:MAG: M50 family metallopeptidase, partial [Planctomycetota bacterium]
MHRSRHLSLGTYVSPRPASLWSASSALAASGEGAPADVSLDSQFSAGEAKEIEQRLTTAYHEAGHAVMALICGRSVQKINIASKKMSFGTRLGVCEMKQGKSGATKDWLEDEVMILLAGMVGESHRTGVLDRAGAAQDMQLVKELIAQRAASDKQFKRLRRRMLEKTEYL